MWTTAGNPFQPEYHDSISRSVNTVIVRDQVQWLLESVGGVAGQKKCQGTTVLSWLQRWKYAPEYEGGAMGGHTQL